MADLVAADITPTVINTRINRGSPGGQKENIVKLVFGDGAKTYGSGGIPLPSFPGFGMLKELQRIDVVDQSATTLTWKPDYINKKLRGYAGTSELTSGATVAAQTIYVSARGW